MLQEFSSLHAINSDKAVVDAVRSCWL